MNIIAPCLVALVLGGCASHPDVAAVGRAVQQATGGVATQPGSVASGGTGYLPLVCPTPQAPSAIAHPDCR